MTAADRAVCERCGAWMIPYTDPTNGWFCECGNERKRMTPDEKEEQRRSFAYGNVKLHNLSVTREMIDKQADRLNDRAVCERIAESFEPKPEDFDLYISPLGVWERNLGTSWRPADFLHDESASALLRDAMLAAGWSVELCPDNFGQIRCGLMKPRTEEDKAKIDPLRRFDRVIGPSAPTALRAIAAAYCRWKGIEFS